MKKVSCKVNTLLLFLILSIFVFPLISPTVTALNQYSIEFYSTNTNDAYNPTLYSPNVSVSEANIEMFSKADLNGSSYTATSFFYSPHTSLIANSERSFTTNQTCVSFGSVNVSNFETRNTLTDNADSSDVTLETQFLLQPAQNVIDFVANTYPYDSSNRSMNTYYSLTAGSGLFLNQTFVDSVATDRMNAFTGDFDECYAPFSSAGRYESSFSMGSGQSVYRIFTRYFVFNASYSGHFNYSYNIHTVGCSCVNSHLCENQFYKVGYYELDSPVWNDIGTASSGSGALTLTAGETYIFQTTASIRLLSTYAGTNNCNIYEYLYNNSYSINTAYPNFLCGDYSECINGTEFRLCVDQDGQLPDRLEYRACYSGPLASVYLGFENHTTENVWYETLNWLCGCDTHLKTVLYPEGWTVSNPNITDNDRVLTGRQYDFVALSSKYSQEGDKSLLMYNLPPQPYMPTQTGSGPSQVVECENMTTGQFPDLYQVISTNNTTSIFVERNITLPSPYMSVRFYVRRCDEPALKGSAPTWPYSYCGIDEMCYTAGQECEVETDGRITFYLKDTATNEFLYDITSEVVYPNNWEIKEYAIDSLEPNLNYTVGLAVVPDSNADPKYYCVYVDNLNIDIRNVPLVCESECSDRTRIERECKEYDNGLCIVCEQTEIVNSELCLGSEQVRLKVSSCSDFCGCEEYAKGNEDYYTLFKGEFVCNETLFGVDKCCLYTEIDNSEYCLDYCDQFFAPNETSEFLSDLNVPEYYHPLLSPLAIVFYIALFIIILTYFGTAYINKGEGSWQISAITGFVFFIILGVLFVELVWIIIIIIVVAGLLFGKMMLFDRSGG